MAAKKRRKTAKRTTAKKRKPDISRLISRLGDDIKSVDGVAKEIRASLGVLYLRVSRPQESYQTENAYLRSLLSEVVDSSQQGQDPHYVPAELIDRARRFLDPTHGLVQAGSPA